MDMVQEITVQLAIKNGTAETVPAFANAYQVT
jgi:hypothetical protein